MRVKQPAQFGRLVRRVSRVVFTPHIKRERRFQQCVKLLGSISVCFVVQFYFILKNRQNARIQQVRGAVQVVCTPD